MVSDPKDYRWCGYAEAMAGRKVAQEGLAVAVSALAGRPVAPQRVLAEYRVQLYGRGEATGHGSGEEGWRRGFDREKVEQVLASGGKLERFEALRCRVRYFTEGVVLGGRSFVEQVFAANRERFGAKRQSGARPMRQISLGGLCTVRDLREGVGIV